MDFVHYDLGQLGPDQVVQVALNIAANVLLLDAVNFNRYQTGNDFRYYGGHVTQSPFQIRVPTHGHWHLAINLGGAAGNLHTDVRILQMPAVR
jgi:hypothetical protein